ncbi:hypothetical protein evm_009353 [Chilo suppressalis]|nr:hypothetical protein evm_009353 [Chilo suppressalis]
MRLGHNCSSSHLAKLGIVNNNICACGTGAEDLNHIFFDFSMSGVIVVRLSQPADEAARVELVRSGFTSYQRDAFLLFFFQELTLQWCVLGGAVLFIFCGVSVTGCLLLLPAAALVVATSVYISHLALADKHVQNMRKEMVGLVAEYRGPLVNDPASVSTRLVSELEGGMREGDGTKGRSARIVGTASVSEAWGSTGGGWLHALAVHPHWRRRGVGRALVGGARVWTGARGLHSLQCVLGELQEGARHLLHRDGWEARGWYHRKVCGSAITLQLAHFSVPTLHTYA